MFCDGQRVSYIGDPTADGLDIGDVALVVAAGHTASGVKWLTGARKGALEEVPHGEITPVASARPDIDALTGSLVTFAVRDVHAQVGANGLLSVLNDHGHLGNFEAIAEEALSLIASRIRTDPSIQEVLAQLEGEDGDDLVSLATVALIRDAFGPGE